MAQNPPDTPLSSPSLHERDLVRECLESCAQGQDPLELPLRLAPTPAPIFDAMMVLGLLGAVDNSGSITSLGKQMAMLPVDAFSAKSILSSVQYDCTDEILTVVSMMVATKNGEDLFQPETEENKATLQKTRAFFRHDSGDHLTLFNIYMAWRWAGMQEAGEKFVEEHLLLVDVLRSADRKRIEILQILVREEPFKSSFEISWLHPDRSDYYEQILRGLAAGNYLRVAKKTPEAAWKIYDLVRGDARVEVTENTQLRETSASKEWIIYGQQKREGTKRTIQLVSSIPPEYLIRANPTYWSEPSLLPGGHIRDGVAAILAHTTSLGPELVRDDPKGE